MNKHLLRCLLLLLPCLAWPVHAQIYKSVDADGHITYSNVPIKGAVKLNIEVAEPNDSSANRNNAEAARGTSGSGSRSKPAATPGKSLRIDPEVQDKRDDKRKKILQDELEAERKALAEAKLAYQEGESNPEVYRAANGKTFRNVAKFDEKMQGLKNEVETHEKNIQLLQKELGSSK
ncbi:MAG: DUF4124 domain-containing protein [Methylophilaceae bacterium]|nr:DUF4124 domain-containing protein [Methylophilaceae bacterium]